MTNKPYQNSRRQSKQTSITDDFRNSAVIVVGVCKENEFRRNNLLINAKLGIEKAIQKGEHVHLFVGSEQNGLTEYVILNAKI